MRAMGGFLVLGLGVLLSVGCSDSPATAPTTTPTTGSMPADTTPVHVPGPTTPAPAGAAFVAVMNGAQEVPAVQSLASGSASFHFSNNGDTIVYAITVSNIEGVTAAHIHTGRPGEVGPPVVDLFVAGPTGRMDGLLIQGTISRQQLEGSLSGTALSDLYSLLASGGAYVNVHTTRYPEGEIRGQVREMPDGEEGGGE